MTAFAAGQSKTINVATGVNLYMDDRQVIPTDANGNPVEVFIYNGTTYVPVRAVSNLFDTPIQWDGQTYGVYIGKHKARGISGGAGGVYGRGADDHEQRGTSDRQHGDTEEPCAARGRF